MAIDNRFAESYWRRRDLGSTGTRSESAGARSEIVIGPVSDWAADFSHLDPE